MELLDITSLEILDTTTGNVTSLQISDQPKYHKLRNIRQREISQAKKHPTTEKYQTTKNNTGLEIQDNQNHKRFHTLINIGSPEIPQAHNRYILRLEISDTTSKSKP